MDTNDINVSDVLTIEENNSKIGVSKLYKRRWLILFLYSIYCISSVIHWYQYNTIIFVIEKYFSVSFIVVSWTSSLIIILYIAFCMIGCYIIDKLGLRISVLIGIIGTCIGTWMKVIAINPSRYWLILLSQTVIAISQIMVLPVPQKLAAVWFGPKEFSLACSIAANSLKLGVILGLTIPPLVVKDGSLESIESGLLNMSYGIAIFTTLLIIILYCYFEDLPPNPPSLAQSAVQESNKVSFDYKKSLINLVTNKSFACLFIAYGVHLGTSMTIWIQLNQQLFEQYSKTAFYHLTVLGLVMNFSGIVGSTALGFLISKFGKLKFITRFSYIGSTVTSILLIYLNNQGLIVVYILGITLAIFWNCIFCIGFELSAELTYPEPQATSGGILTIFDHLFNIILTPLFLYINFSLSSFVANIGLVLLILLADVLLVFIKFDLKRSSVDDKTTKENRVL